MSSTPSASSFATRSPLGLHLTFPPPLNIFRLCIGPSSDQFHWVPQITKFIERVQLIRDSGVATSLAIKTYNLKAATVFSYPAQFLPPPPTLTKLE
eukprot:10481041-Karenia_brevis.AAC.1